MDFMLVILKQLQHKLNSRPRRMRKPFICMEREKKFPSLRNNLICKLHLCQLVRNESDKDKDLFRTSL